MALSGDLETFSLPDVLRLLATTKKTGRLAVQGDRGTGALWVQDGSITDAEAERSLAADVDGVLFELLRFAQGTFSFDSTAFPRAGAGAARDVEDALHVGESRLAEWREIEAVVPSLDVHLRMVTHVDGDVTVTPDDWKVLARVGTGATGQQVARDLGQGEYELSRHLRDLIQGRLVELVEVEAEPAVPAEPPFRAEPERSARPDPFAEADPEPQPERAADAEPAVEQEPMWGTEREAAEDRPARTGLGRAWPGEEEQPPAPWPEVKPVSSSSDHERTEDVDQRLLGRILNPRH